MSLKRIFLFFLVFNTLLPGVVHAGVSCINLIGQSKSLRLVGEDPFTNSDRIEEKLSSLINGISSEFGANTAMNARLEEILQMANEEMNALQLVQERLLEGEVVFPVEFQGFYKRFDEIKKTLTEVTESVETLVVTKKESQRLQLNDIIVEPSSVKAETPYVVELVSGERLSVIIAEDLAKNLFVDPQRTRIISRSLRKIQLGIFGKNYLADGIIRMHADSSVVEIRSLGRGGSFRFFGYLENGNLYLVHYTISANHTGPATRRNVTQVIAIREARESNTNSRK